MLYKIHFIFRALVFWIGLAAFFAGLPSASAQLKWDHEFVDLRASPEDERIEIRFPFKNEGHTPITVKKLKSSCGCTTATLSKATYLPGERGTVIALFEIGNRVGFNDKNVVVTTDDPSDPETSLAFRIYIWKTVTITPSVLFWKPDEIRTTQTVRFRVAQEMSLNLVRLECSSPAWRAELLTVIPGWEYEVKVTRLESSKVTSGVVTVFADTPELNPQIFKIRLRVK